MKWLLVLVVLFAVGKVLVGQYTARQVDQNMVRVAAEINAKLPLTGDLARLDSVEYSDHVMRYSGSLLEKQELTEELTARLTKRLTDLYCENKAIKEAGVAVQYSLQKTSLAGFNDKVRSQAWTQTVRPADCGT